MDLKRIREVYENSNSIEEMYEELKDNEFEGLSFEEFKKAVDNGKSINELSDEELKEISGGVRVFGGDIGIFHWGKWEPFTTSRGEEVYYCPKCGKNTRTESRTIFYVVGMSEEKRCEGCHTYRGYREQHVHGGTRSFPKRRR